MSTGTTVSTIGAGVSTLGGVLSSTPAGPWLIGGGALLSGLGMMLGGDEPPPQTVVQQEQRSPGTPYRVKLPSGAVITMYAPGSGVTRTTKTTGGGISDYQKAYAIGTLGSTVGGLLEKNKTPAAGYQLPYAPDQIPVSGTLANDPALAYANRAW